MRPETKKTENSLAAEACKRGIMARLAEDDKGNALMITAALLLPICAAIGGGVDMSRAYLAKARLNQACDAAALSARRLMTGNDITSADNATNRKEATKFFNYNFPAGTMNSSPISAPDGTAGPTYTKPSSDGIVQVSAATTIPTTIMRIFGYKNIPISVTCESRQNLINVDLVLVLDTTGSMAYDMENTNYLGDSDSKSKMYALKDGVRALYNALSGAQKVLSDNNLRLRYGIVPYTSSVNIGSSLTTTQRTNYIRTSASYYTTTSSETKYYCSKGTYNESTKKCSDKKGSVIPYTQYYYGMQNNVSTSTYVSNIGKSGGWNGCIEERDTINTIKDGDSYSSIPKDALDLNINLVPNSTESRWAPQWQSKVSYPDVSQGNPPITPSAACPAAVTKLRTIATLTDLNTILSKISSSGGTYHDIGMIWGARLISTSGIFAPPETTAANGGNVGTFNDKPVARYIIFMTDGKMEPTATAYSAYGVERYYRRTIPGNPGDAIDDNSDESNPGIHVRTHNQRFLMACTEAKKIASVWTIAFAKTDKEKLRQCADNPQQYYLSDSAVALTNAFKEIAQSIIALRISK